MHARSLGILVILVAAVSGQVTVADPYSECLLELPKSVCNQGRGDTLIELYPRWCNEGAITEETARSIDKSVVPMVRHFCRGLWEGHDLEEVRARLKLDLQCNIAGGYIRDVENNSLMQIVGLVTSVDEIFIENYEEILTICNDVNQGRKQASDGLFEVDRVNREMERQAWKSIFSGFWDSLAWPFKLLVAGLGVVSTVVGIAVGVKALSKRNS